MKKVVLSAIALFVGAVGFSQVTDGDGNSSSDPTVIAALPGAGAGANTGLSVQYGNAQRVRVRQAGTRQSAYTVQDNGSGAGGNQAFVRQTGAVGPNSGVLNAAEVLQSGTTNSSLTRQEGDRNKANTRQGQNNDASANNKAYIRQGNANQAERNFAQIDQDGNGNLASTVQTYDNNDAWTQQDGTENKSMIRQNGGPNGTAGHYASVQQEGLGNDSTVMQQGAGARNTAYSLQVGELNQAKQMQNTSAAAGTGNRAGVIQGVDGHSQGTIFGNIIPASNDIWFRIDAEVDGEARPVTVNSLQSFGARAKQTQDGFRNEADILQAGGLGAGESNYAEQDQDDAASSRNQAGIVQGWRSLFGRTQDNYAKQKQRGDRNVAGIVQEGAENKAYQYQNGSRNEALSFQIGAENKLNTHQFGDRNVAHSTQWGVNNKALIVQYDGQSYTVQQGVGVGAFDNQADILQVGPDGNFGPDYAIDCDFDDPMNLDMDFSVPMVMNPDICTDCNN